MQLLASLHNSGRSTQTIQIFVHTQSAELAISGWNTVDYMTPCDARLMTPICRHLRVLHHDALSCAGSVTHSDTSLTKMSPSLSIRLLLMGIDLICGRHQLSHHIHHIFFPLSQRVDTSSNPVIGEGVNAPASVVQWRRTVHVRPLGAVAMKWMTAARARTWWETKRKLTTRQSQILSGPSSATTNSVCSCCRHRISRPVGGICIWVSAWKIQHFWIPVSLECTRSRWCSFRHIYGQFNQGHPFTTFRYEIRPKSHFSWLCSRSGADMITKSNLTSLL